MNQYPRTLTRHATAGATSALVRAPFVFAFVLTLALAMIGTSTVLAQEYVEPRVDRNVVYGMVSGAALLMDVYHPPEPNGVGVVWIRGSGWQAPPPYELWQLKGSGIWRPMLDAGYTVFSINHRGAPMFRYPAAVHDAQRAVRFIRHHAELYGIDPDRIGGWGHSSGGHLVSMLATLDGAGEADHPDPVERESSRLQAVVSRAAPTSLAEFDSRSVALVVSFMGSPPDPGKPEYQDGSPITHVTPDDSPILVIHGDQDLSVPFQQAEVMYAALERHGVEAKLIRVPGGGHGANDPSEVLRWLNGHLLGPEAAAALESLVEANELRRGGRRMAAEGLISEALTAYDEVPERDPRLTIVPGDWNVLCWQGGLWERPAEVLHACDRAVELDPDHLEYKDSRGLVRALLGDFEGAIEDFEFFIEQIWWNPNRRAQRQAWVDALRAGENPFTPELLAELRG